MNKSILILFIAVFLMSCGGKTENKEYDSQSHEQAAIADNTSVINVYYFHGKQRCKTCIAVGDLAKKTIEETYVGNGDVRFIEVDTSNEQFDDLVNKYEVSWNALIIAKGDNSIDITEEAFANAISNPAVLSDLIKKEVNQRVTL